MVPTEPADHVLAVDGLRVEYDLPRPHPLARRPDPFVAVRDVSFSVDAGETVALVGESGSGKSTIGNAILGIAPVAAGAIHFQGAAITHAAGARRRDVARQLQVIFQNPYGSLNPARTIGDILAEPLHAVGTHSRRESRAIVARLLERVGMPADAVDRYPGNFSGGQRQRIAIARALAVSPKLIVCDEPTSALDVSTQKVVLELLDEIQRETRVGYLFITHDLAVVRHFADRVAVLERGAIVEMGDAAAVCDTPQHPYTRRLVAAAPVPDPVVQAGRRAAWRDTIANKAAEDVDAN